MNAHVALQARRPGKQFLTIITGMLFLFWMDEHVSSQVGWSSEWLPTMFTWIGFLSCMNAHVLSQAGRSIKWFPTMFTWIWFLSCMNAHVHLQLWRWQKWLFTMFTWMLFLSVICLGLSILASFHAAVTSGGLNGLECISRNDACRQCREDLLRLYTWICLLYTGRVHMCPGLVHWWAYNLNDHKRFLSLENSSTVFWTLQIAIHTLLTAHLHIQ